MCATHKHVTIYRQLRQNWRQLGAEHAQTEHPCPPPQQAVPNPLTSSRRFTGVKRKQTPASSSSSSARPDCAPSAYRGHLLSLSQVTHYLKCVHSARSNLEQMKWLRFSVSHNNSFTLSDRKRLTTTREVSALGWKNVMVLETLAQSAQTKCTQEIIYAVGTATFERYTIYILHWRFIHTYFSIHNLFSTYICI